MPNPNYESGRRFEYEMMKLWKSQGSIVLRTAGSHGFADLIRVSKDGGYTDFVQLKVVSEEAEALRMIANFKKGPTFPPATASFHQTLMVKVKRGTIHSWTI